MSTGRASPGSDSFPTFATDDDFTPTTAFKVTFGGEDLVDAYKWNKDKILTFLKNVSDKPDDYKVPENLQTHLKDLYNAINDLRSPDGTKFKAPHPAQQLLRTKDDLQPTVPIPWRNDKKETFFIMFDLLGLFLSLMGAPPTTESEELTPKNYSLPLVALYARWCKVLTHSPKFLPSMAQITWATSTDGKTFYPFLGTSIGGIAKDKVWPGRVKEARWKYLENILEDPWKEFGKSPEIDRMGASGTNFGNCGETYPFLYILADTGLVARAYGIAIVPAAMDDEYKGEGYWKLEPMRPPCVNCAQLLKWYDVPDPSRFELYNT